MIIARNELLKINDTDVERVLWVDDGYIICYTINLNDEKALPEKRSISELEEGLREGYIQKIDEIYCLSVDEESLKDKHRHIRDNAWSVIKELVQDSNEPNIYVSKHRSKLIDNACIEFNTTKVTLYKYLRKYWKRGMIPNALLPDYYNSGGKGKAREAGEKKLGRPRKNKDVLGLGINVNEEIERIFNVAINKFYYNSNRATLISAYNQMIKEFFTEDIGNEHIVKSSSEIPTFGQFQYWFNKQRNIKIEVSSRQSSKKYELKHRSVLGRSDEWVLGPCSEFQIDATIGDVYLVSRYDRSKIIGRPVIYIVEDVFSRMITGVYVGLEGPSWNGAMMALANTVADKVQFCKEYGIDIAESEWASKYLPETLVADRGEIESSKIDNLIRNLNITVKNMPPYRADWKGIVEQNFRLINLNFKDMVSGTIDDDFRERGGNDYRLDAKLDIYEFTQIIIKCVLFHNNHHYLKSYVRDEQMIQDNVEPIPSNLWAWGVKNRSGKIRTYSEDIVKFNLMPSDVATVTHKGIKFKGMIYSCETALKENWFEISRQKGVWKIDISYDPRNMDAIYIKQDNGLNFERGNLLEHQNRYKSKTLFEIESLLQSETRQQQISKDNILQAKVNLMSDIEAIFKDAEKKTNKEANPNVSKTKKLKNIKENRAIEKQLNREKESFSLAEENKVELINTQIYDFVKAQQSLNVSEYENIDEDVVDNISLLRKKQKEALRNGRKK